MSVSPKRCLFLDACVAFAEILGENKDVMEKLKLDVKRKRIPCYISKSAKVECERKLDYTQSFLESVFRTVAEGHFNFCRQQIGKNPSDPISKDDFQIFASLFNELRKSVSLILQRPLRTLEIKMVVAAEKVVKKGPKIDFRSFLQRFVTEALLLAAHIKIQKVKFITNEQGFFKKNPILPDRRVSDQLLAKIRASRRHPFHKGDADNISSAWAHMNKTGQITVFTSFDFRSIISHAEEIYKLIKLHCVDPLYAVQFI